MRHTRLSIAGLDVDTDRLAETRNPATAQVHGYYCQADASHTAAAADAAVAAAPHWGALSPWERRRTIRAIAQAIREQADSIARVITEEVGKPLAEARGEVAVSADAFDWAAEEACRPDRLAMDGYVAANRVETMQVPIGPTLALTPSNFPFNLPARKLSAALAAGCPVILRPAEEAPGTAAALIACCIAAGLPPGTVGLLLGPPADTIAPLMQDNRIRAVSFTGSTRVGKLLIAQSASTVKRLVLELGGHAPFLVLDDADASEAGRLAAIGKFRNAGQVCTSPTRFIVDASKYESFVAALVAGAGGQVLGNGADTKVTMGPLATERQLRHIESLVEDAVAKGAKVRCGGQRAANAGAGYFYAPTVLAEVPADAAIRREEPFGPVAIVDSVKTLDEAIDLANQTEAGLAGYVFGHRTAAVERVSIELEVGVLGVNSIALSALEAPFGGVKQSGYGKEGGRAGIDEFRVTRALHRLVR